MWREEECCGYRGREIDGYRRRESGAYGGQVSSGYRKRCGYRSCTEGGKDGSTEEWKVVGTDGGGGGGGESGGYRWRESCWYREKESGGYRQTESCWYGGRESRLRESCWYGGRKSGGYSEGELQVQREGKVGVRSGGKLWVW